MATRPVKLDELKVSVGQLRMMLAQLSQDEFEEISIEDLLMLVRAMLIANKTIIPQGGKADEREHQH